MSASRKTKAENSNVEKKDNKKQRNKFGGGKAKANDQEQLEEYAFNLYGWAYKHGLEGRQKNRIVNGHALSTTQWVKAVQRIKDADGTVAWRAATDPYTDREMDEQYAEGGVKKYLVVGVCPPFFDLKKHAIKPASLKSGTPVGVSKPAEDQLIQPADGEEQQSDRPPLLVVTPMVDGPPIGGTKYFVLLTRKAGLPEVYNTDRDSTFFFPEFRDSVPRGKVREKTWKMLIERQSVRSTLAKPTDTKKLTVDKRSRDSSFKVSLNPTTFYGDLKLLKDAIEKTGLGNDYRAACGRLEELLSQLNALHFSPNLDSFRSLLRLNDDADEDLDLGETFLRDLRRAIVRTKTEVPLHHIQVFLAASSILDKNIDELVKDAAEIARLGVRPPSNVQSSKSDESSIVRAVLGRLQDIIKYNQQVVDSFDSMGSDALEEETPFQLFEEYKNAADYENAKTIFGETSRWLAHKLAFGIRESVEKLKDLVEVVQGQKSD